MADGRNEPSMDEILSSIKRIITDDDQNRPAAKRLAKTAAGDKDESEILELTEAAENATRDDVLLDDTKAQSLRHSFSALQTLSEPGAAPQVVRSGETSLEGMVREMLRPMLSNWLEANLPAMVEKMVSAEIARIAGKRG